MGLFTSFHSTRYNSSFPFSLTFLKEHLNDLNTDRDEYLPLCHLHNPFPVDSMTLTPASPHLLSCPAASPAGHRNMEINTFIRNRFCCDLSFLSASGFKGKTVETIYNSKHLFSDVRIASKSSCYTKTRTEVRSHSQNCSYLPNKDM